MTPGSSPMRPTRRPSPGRGGAQTAEGNPLFIAQLAPSIGRPLPAGSPRTSAKSSPRALTALPRDERALLLDASVVGRCSGSTRAALNDETPTPCRRLLDRLERRDLIRRETGSIIEGKPQYAFTHAVIREVAYEMLARAERTRRHALVAEFFSRTIGGTAEAIGVMARHWRAAGGHDLAVEHLIRAAQVAEAGWAKDHAAFLYREALSLIPDEDTRAAPAGASGWRWPAPHHARPRYQAAGKSAGVTSPAISSIESIPCRPSRASARARCPRPARRRCSTCGLCPRHRRRRGCAAR